MPSSIKFTTVPSAVLSSSWRLVDLLQRLFRLLAVKDRTDGSWQAGVLEAQKVGNFIHSFQRLNEEER